jgi:uncharacterized protein (TIGR03435 family)
MFSSPASIEGAPAWASSDRYTISAKTEGDPRQEMMRGPMLQAILEDRFKLTLHLETREVPTYDLTVLKTGLKAEPLEGGCDPLDLARGPRPGRLSPDGFTEFLQPDQNLTCGMLANTTRGASDPNLTVFAQAMGLKELAGVLRGYVNRPIIDKTGIAGLFNFRVQFFRDQAVGILAPADPQTATDPAAPSIYTAIQEQLGLKLEPSRGPGQFLVVDHLERPSEN